MKPRGLVPSGASGGPTAAAPVPLRRTASGGGANAVLRASTAGLPNAAHPDLAYACTVAEVIAFVQEAFASGDFSIAGPLDDANNAGCPLN